MSCFLGKKNNTKYMTPSFYYQAKGVLKEPDNT